MAKLSCPVDCMDKHNATRETMAVIKTKLDNIECKLDTTIEAFNKLSEEKADKKDVEKINTVIWATVVGLIGLLITIIFLLIRIQ